MQNPGRFTRPPTEVMVSFVDANRYEFGVEPICQDTVASGRTPSSISDGFNQP